MQMFFQFFYFFKYFIDDRNQLNPHIKAKTSISNKNISAEILSKYILSKTELRLETINTKIIKLNKNEAKEYITH